MTDSKMRVGALIGTLVVGATAGYLIGLAMGGGPSEKAPSDPPSAVVGPGPTSEENGVPVGYARTREGAVAAASNFALLTASDELFDSRALISAMKTLAAPEWQGQAEQQARNGYEFIKERYGDGADVSGSVVRYLVGDYNADRAIVELWAVSLASGVASPDVDEVWSTLTVELSWVDGDWRISAHESSPGPSPVDLPTDGATESARTVMEEFSEFGLAPSP